MAHLYRSTRQGRQTNLFRLKPSSMASVKANYRKIAVGQGVKVPSLDILGQKSLD